MNTQPMVRPSIARRAGVNLRRERRGQPQAQRGFTLIELLVTVTVLAVTLAIATPSMYGFIRSSQMNGTQTELAAALALARSEATKRSARVGLTAVSPSTGAEFNNGWTVWVDSDNDGVVDNGETIIREYPARRNSVTVSTVGGENKVIFLSSGFVSGSSSITFKICGRNATTGLRVALDPVGLTDSQEKKACP